MKTSNLLAAAILTGVLASPAFSFSVAVDFPTLTWPTPPVTSQDSSVPQTPVTGQLPG